MKGTEHYFPMVLFIILYKVVLTFQSVDEIVTIQMKATEQYFFFGAVYYALQSGCNVSIAILSTL